ncbi:hypothetical protein J3A83DRAFT_2178016 [Scleroderma citrinum]
MNTSSNTISVTTSILDQSKAATYLSACLELLGCPHAYIGGFAWSLLGSNRPTQDIDVLIDTKNWRMEDLRQKLLELNSQFASVGIKLYFVKEGKDDLTGKVLVQKSKHNVLIETLSTGSLGLPAVVEPIYKISQEITILHPGVLLLTKIKRWYHNRDSTYPKTVAKRISDKKDLNYMVIWLAVNNMTIEFEKYKGKSKTELLKFVRYYREQVKTDKVIIENLQKAMKPGDWALL